VKFSVRAVHQGFIDTVRWHLAPFFRDAPGSSSFTVSLYVQEKHERLDPPPLSYFVDKSYRAKAEERWLGDVLSEVLYDVWRLFASLTGDYLLLHSGSVVSPGGGAILLPARMDTGKTSTTLALLRSGFAYLSDEFGAIDPVTQRVYPVPRPMALDRDSLRWFEGLEALLVDKQIPVKLSKRFVRPQDVGAPVGGPSDIAAVVFPAPIFEGAPELSPINASDSVIRMMHQSFNMERYGDRGVVLLGRLAKAAPAFELRGGTPTERADLLAERFG
jgi:hypothetical protein